MAMRVKLTTEGDLAARSKYQGGIHSLADAHHGPLSGRDGKLLRSIWGYDPLDFEMDIEAELAARQVKQPDRFVQKIAARGGREAAVGTDDLSKDEVLKVLAAAEFSAAFSMYLDVLVTLDFGRMGIADPEKARMELQRFLKAANSWLGERGLPVAWVANIERDSKDGLHAHIALHVPGLRVEEHELIGVRHRTHFRSWARDAVRRRVGRRIPRAVNVRCSLKSSIISHWICVTYLLKGFDRNVVLMAARNRQDGEDLRLADILPFPYRSAGDVGLERRIMVSGNLGAGRRAVGIPPGAAPQLPSQPDILSLQVATEGAPIPTRRARSSPPHGPFRSSVEDGVFDVRRVYGADFAAFVSRLKPRPAPAGPIPSDIYAPDLLTFLNDLGI